MIIGYFLSFSSKDTASEYRMSVCSVCVEEFEIDV